MTPVDNVDVFILGYGLVSMITVLAILTAAPLLLPRLIVEERWTVGRNIAFVLVIVFLIGTANLYYTHVFAGMPISAKSFFVFQLYTVSVSTVVASVATFVRYVISLKRYQHEALVVNKELADNLPIETIHQGAAVDALQPIVIKSENDKETLTFAADELLYVESADNYSDVCFLQNGLVTHKLVRSTLKRIEDNLSHSLCFRCHRSFIVNIGKVSHVTGNSQGYKLHLQGGDKPISVSRSLNEALRHRINTRNTVPPSR